jgi:hypothetical protein
MQDDEVPGRPAARGFAGTLKRSETELACRESRVFDSSPWRRLIDVVMSGYWHRQPSRSGFDHRGQVAWEVENE